MPKISPLSSHCFVNAPFGRLTDNDLLKTFLEHRIQPEIGLEGEFLYTVDRGEFKRLSKRFQDAGLPCTLHAPFYDLSPGALDSKIRQVSLNKLRLAFDLIEIFKPVSIVCHLGFEQNKHGFKEDQWFTNSLATWRELLKIAEHHKVPMMLENTYETGPKQLRDVLAALDSPYARFCLDVGHVMSFAKNTWQDWLPELLPWLGQLHLHDNHGDYDQHLPVGAGGFDFSGLFEFLADQKTRPVVTLEPHQEEGLWQSLTALEEMESFQKLLGTNQPG